MIPHVGDERPDGIAVECDQDGRILRIIRDGLGIAAGVVPGQPFTALMHPEATAKTHAFLDAARTQHAAFDWEIAVSVAGRPTIVHFSCGTARDGTVVVVGSTSGATAPRDSHLYDELSRLNNELGTAHRELAKRTAELERLNEQKNEFLGIAAHDLRSPLGVIATYSDWLLDDAEGMLSADHREIMECIRSSSTFMLRLITDLLDISKIEAGKLTLDLQETDLIRLVERNVTLNGHIARRKGIALVFDHGGRPVVATIDPVKIEQVLTNLITNAIKFSPPDTTVTVRLSEQDEAAVIAVQDEGPGIPAHEHAKLFQPFQQTSVRSTAGEEGSGLGLAIVRKIVEGHRGRIRLDSEVGKGSTFSVSLPLGLTP